MTTKRRNQLLVAIGILIIIGPAAATRIGVPSSSTFEQRRAIPIGTLQTASGSKVDIYGVWGDIFDPRRARSDLGFDMAVTSMYFDPLVESNHQMIIIGNPVLWSAISRSLNSETELQHLSNNLILALSESRRAVGCFLGDVPTGCEGDQIVPYFWPVLPNSELGQNRVKYLAAAPLFDPTILTNKMEPAEARERLAENIKAVAQRILTRAAEDLDNSVSSVAFAALGSTSIKGGDSPYFLPFAEGFQQILAGIEDSRPPSSLSRIYLVAYDRHTGIFKTEALNALESAAQDLRARELVERYSFAFGGALAILFSLFGAISYQGVERIVASHNRWEFAEKVLAAAPAAAAVVWGATVAVAQATQHYEFHLSVTYAAAAIVALMFVLGLSKRVS